jgi:REP element-mobilizing transposase RayT
LSRTRYRFGEDEYPYFITCTINGWLPVFTRNETAEIILDSWRHLQKNDGLVLFAYVILENHIHWIARCDGIEKVVGRFKSFTPRRVIDFLRQRCVTTLLDQLRYRKAVYKSDSEFQLWQEGSHPKQIDGDDMMWQKVEYIHNNPLERGFVDDPTHWRWSSARN